jgi:hypothetical protein
VIVWAVTAAAGGGLTLWLQDAAEPPKPRAPHQSDAPAPLLGVEVGDEWGCPSDETAPDGTQVQVLCAYAETR